MDGMCAEQRTKRVPSPNARTHARTHDHRISHNHEQCDAVKNAPGLGVGLALHGAPQPLEVAQPRLAADGGAAAVDCRLRQGHLDAKGRRDDGGGRDRGLLREPRLVGLGRARHIGARRVARRVGPGPGRHARVRGGARVGFGDELGRPLRVDELLVEALPLHHEGALRAVAQQRRGLRGVRGRLVEVPDVPARHAWALGLLGPGGADEPAVALEHLLRRGLIRGERDAPDGALRQRILVHGRREPRLEERGDRVGVVQGRAPQRVPVQARRRGRRRPHSHFRHGGGCCCLSRAGFWERARERKARKRKKTKRTLKQLHSCVAVALAGWAAAGVGCWEYNAAKIIYVHPRHAK